MINPIVIGFLGLTPPMLRCSIPAGLIPIMIVKPDGFILAGSNHGISKFYDAESMYCDYLEIQFDSTTYIATSRKGVINILHNLKKGDRVGEHEIVE